MAEALAVRVGELAATAQFNADLADALHANLSPLCIYLLDMRDFFRWERRLELGDDISRSELGAWIGSREAHWDGLRGDGEDAAPAYRPLLPRLSDDPFETSALRQTLAANRLVYGAGIGRFGRPQFFLGRELSRELREGNQIVICGEELARGATAAPAMSRGDEILVRQDALERWLWSRFEEWQLHRHDNGLAAAYALHAATLAADAAPPQVIRRMAAVEREALILHELGERRIDAELGDDWHDMLDGMPSRKAEALARAVRDLLADCTVTLPTLAEQGALASLHCWFGLLEGLRLTLAPGLHDDYQAWRRAHPADAGAAGRLPGRASLRLQKIRFNAARRHFADAASRLLDAWRRNGTAGVEALLDQPAMVFGRR